MKKLYLAGQSRLDTWIAMIGHFIENQFPIEITERWWSHPVPYSGEEPDLMDRKRAFWRDLATQDRAGVRAANHVLAVLYPGVQINGVWWELGLAEGLGIPTTVLVIAPPRHIPQDPGMQAIVFDQVFLSDRNVVMLENRLFHKAVVDRIQQDYTAEQATCDSTWAMGEGNYLLETRARLAQVLLLTLEDILLPEINAPDPPAPRKFLTPREENPNWSCDPFGGIKGFAG